MKFLYNTLNMDKSIKEHVKELLEKRDYDRLFELCESDRKYWKEVRFKLYDIDEKLLWPAIETFALIMKRWWEAGKEGKVREYIRNLFWSINDESGGIGWNSPQTIAEIITKIPPLIDPYGSMMIAHCLEEPSLVKGCLWGIGRLGKRLAESLDFFKDKVLSVFQSDDIETLGLAAWAMGEAGFKPAMPFIEKLLWIKDPVRIYIERDFREKSLKKWAECAIAKIENRNRYQSTL
jgi:hypothetical protein